MGFEPNAAWRLQMICADTSDVMLRSEIETLLPSRRPNTGMEYLAPTPVTFDDERPQAAPSFSPPVSEFVSDLMSSRDVHAELLNAFAAQAKAVQLVWEAHRRGAIELPASVLESVSRARTLPRFLLDLR